MKLYYDGRGSRAWRDPRNWVHEDGSPVYSMHLRRGESLVVEGSGEIDLRDCPAPVEVCEFVGKIRMPGSRGWIHFTPSPSRRVRLANRLASRRVRTAPMVPKAWHDGVRVGLARVAIAALAIVVPVIGGGAATTYHWVGGSATWDNADASHWSLTQNGGGGAGVPVAGDTVIFDGSTAGVTVTVAATAAAATVTVNKSDLTLSHGAANTTFCTGTLTLTTGTWTTGGNSLTLGNFSSNNTNARTYTLGSSAITVTGTGTVWDCSAISNLTVTANTATVTMSGAGVTFGSGGKNYNGLGLVFTGSGTAAITGSNNTFGALTRTGTTAKADALSFAGPQTVTGTVTLGGNTTQGVNRLFVQASNVGTQRTITAAAYVITGDCNFSDINLAYSGAASWTNAGNAWIGDALGNAGAVTTNATASVAQAQSIAASFTWSTAPWTTRVPLPQDDATVTGNGAGQTITLDMPRTCRNLDMSAVTGTPTFTATAVGWAVYGNLTLGNAITWTGTNTTMTLNGRGAQTLTSGSVTIGSATTIQATGGSYTLQDNLSLPARQLTLAQGTFTANNKNVSTGVFVSNSTNTRTLNMGSGNWTLSSTSTITVWNLVTTNLTFNSSTSTIKITATDSGVTKTFAGGGASYSTVQHISAGSATLSITGSNTFAVLDLECTTARSVLYPVNGTQYVTQSLIQSGAAGQALTFHSADSATQTAIALVGAATLTQSNYVVGAEVHIYRWVPQQT